jgi:hypothetical protein
VKLSVTRLPTTTASTGWPWLNMSNKIGSVGAVVLVGPRCGGVERCVVVVCVVVVVGAAVVVVDVVTVVAWLVVEDSVVLSVVLGGKSGRWNTSFVVVSSVVEVDHLGALVLVVGLDLEVVGVVDVGVVCVLLVLVEVEEVVEVEEEEVDLRLEKEED